MDVGVSNSICVFISGSAQRADILKAYIQSKTTSIVEKVTYTSVRNSLGRKTRFCYHVLLQPLQQIPGCAVADHIGPFKVIKVIFLSVLQKTMKRILKQKSHPLTKVTKL